MICHSNSAKRMIRITIAEHSILLQFAYQLLSKYQLFGGVNWCWTDRGQSPHSLPTVINYKMKQATVVPQKVLTKSSKGQSAGSAPKMAAQKSKKQAVKKTKYKIDAITKDNFQASSGKMNITEIKQLPLKYVLKCIDGLYKNRYIFITTHPEGEIFGSGDVKLYGLTLQIEGVGLAPKHAQLKYDGFKSFNVIDFHSDSGTWMNISQQGVQIKNGQHFSIGPHMVQFQYTLPINEIEQICSVYHISYLSDVLEYNGIKTLSQLYAANYSHFEGYPFEVKEIQKLERVCEESKTWYEEGKKYKRLNMHFLNQPLKDFSLEIGWESFHVSSDPDLILHGKNPIAEVRKGKLLPSTKIFTKINPQKYVPLTLHSQIRIGNLSFEMIRFNAGTGQDQGFRDGMQDALVIEEDVGGSEWKLISLFAVVDGHGGPECAEYVKKHLIEKVRGWTTLLDEAGDLNEMVKVLMNKTFFQLDYEFYKEYGELAMTCGCTALVMLIIQSKVYTFHVGDCKSYLFRDQILYKMNIDHLPSRGDERNRIESAGGFVQYDRLMGKCTLSRCLGQFQYKNIQDYENQLKGKLKSYLSCIPDLICFDIRVGNDDFILISTDGIFQAMDIFQVTDFIKERYDKLELEQNPNKIISGIIQNCKIINPTVDNMALILIIIRKGELIA